MVTVGLGILRRELGADTIHVSPCLLQCHAVFHTGVDVQEVAGPRRRAWRRRKRKRCPELNRVVRKLEGRRQHAHDFVRHRIEQDLPADNRIVAAESFCPDLVSKNHDPVLPDDRLVRTERAAQTWRDAEDVEERRGHGAREQSNRLAGAGQISGDYGHAGDCRKRPVHRRPVQEVGWRDHVVEDAFGVSLLPHHDEAIGVRIGKRPKENGVDRGEDRGVGSDPECQREYRNHADARLLDEQPQRVVHVLSKCLHPEPPSPERTGTRRSTVRRPQTSLGESVLQRIERGRRPDADEARIPPAGVVQLVEEHLLHVAAELASHPAGECQEEQPVERALEQAHQPFRARSRFDLASRTAASSLRASAIATSPPSFVRRKYRRRSSSSAFLARSGESSIKPSASIPRSVR